PVCGRVGSRKAITYANSCVAKTNGARVLHKGRCRRTSGCAKTLNPVCGRVPGQQAITYSNACMARANGARILYLGTCG
ncbi:MAG: hypothetical protein ACR2PM_21075, partial [Hyphomicrobiales bacterium]